MKRFRITLAGLFVVLAVASSGFTDETPSALDSASIGKVIDTISQKLEERYVFPDVATKMGEDLRRRLKAGEYANPQSGSDLAVLLTKHLQEISKDKHLRVRFSADKLPPQSKSGPTPEMIARNKRMVQQANAGFRKVERLPGNIGYIAFDYFAEAETIQRPAEAAMSFLADADALIIDLRKNGGGNPTGIQVVCSYLFPPEPSIHLNSLYFRPDDRTEEFWTLKDLKGPRFLSKPVYVLTSSRTFSGAEECAYNLQSRQRATIVGETTGGGAHPGGTVRLSDHFSMFISTGRAINPVTKTNWEGVGVKPDVAVAADQALDTAHKLALEKLLSGADEETKRIINADLERSKDRR
jgi:C-terminal processing protease CtpA/Prc